MDMTSSHVRPDGRSEQLGWALKAGRDLAARRYLQRCRTNSPAIDSLLPSIHI